MPFNTKPIISYGWTYADPRLVKLPMVPLCQYCPPWGWHNDLPIMELLPVIKAIALTSQKPTQKPAQDGQQ